MAGSSVRFSCSLQELGGVDTERVKYLTAPSDIKGTVLHLLTEIDDEEWIYWCVDDKYPIQLVTDKIAHPDFPRHALAGSRRSFILQMPSDPK